MWLNRDGVPKLKKKIVDEKAAIEKKRQAKREEWSRYIRDADEEKLIERYKKDPILRSLSWLIDELRPEIKEKL